jgi:hypothetical protein
VLGFLKSEALHPADFTTREDGVARLNPELARQAAAIAKAHMEKHAGQLVKVLYCELINDVQHSDLLKLQCVLWLRE